MVAMNRFDAYRMMSDPAAAPVMVMDPEYITGDVPTSIPWFLIGGAVLAFLLLRKK